MKKLIAYIDGTCKGNPGPAGIGVVIYNESGAIVYEAGKSIGEATNNLAEYEAFIHALEKAAELKCEVLYVNTDSELLARQINGFYKVKDANLRDLFLKAKGLMHNFNDIRVRHIDREDNKYADNLADQALWPQNSEKEPK